MAETKIGFAAVAAFCLALSGCAPRFTWEKYEVDGHITGVFAPDAGNVEEALGKVGGDVYLSPSGRTFNGGATVAVARDMVAAQPAMAELKTVVAYSNHGLSSESPESPLSNFLVDNMMAAVEKETGRKVDIGILNFGGIRVDIPAGNVIRDDIVSMLPFRNNLALVTLKGKDVLDIFKFLAADRVQAVGGVKFTVRNGNVEELLVGGVPPDPERLYSVATVDFLLDGGDGLKVAKNAVELIISDKRIGDVIMASVLKLTEEGRTLDYGRDGRVVVMND